MPIRPESIVIRRLTADDAPAFQALRLGLGALETCPTAFGASVEDERALEMSAVVRRIAPVDHGNAGGVGAFDVMPREMSELSYWDAFYSAFGGDNLCLPGSLPSTACGQCDLRQTGLWPTGRRFDVREANILFR